MYSLGGESESSEILGNSSATALLKSLWTSLGLLSPGEGLNPPFSWADSDAAEDRIECASFSKEVPLTQSSEGSRNGFEPTEYGLPARARSSELAREESGVR